MADTVNVPALGKVPKKELGIGVAVVGGLVVIYYIRKKNSTSATAAAAATTTDQYPPDGTVGNPQDPYSTDPATGQTYGDEAIGAGTYGAYGTSAAGYGTSPAGNAPAPTGTVANGPPFSTNAQWSNWVIAQMTANNSQQDPGVLTDALGLYLSGQPVDTSQQQLIFDAIAIGGDPPVAGPNNYPPNVQLNGNPGGTNPGTCPAGYTFSATQTGAAGEVAATGGSGFCELKNPAPPPPPSPPPPPPRPPTPAPQAVYVTVTPWPTTDSTLWGIANSHGIGDWHQLLTLNPWLNSRPLTAGAPTLYTGDSIRIS